MSNASGKQALVPCIKENFCMLAMRPHHFFRLPEFHLITAVYLWTYGAANLTDLFCKRHFYVDPFLPVFVAATIANMTTCIFKDRAFTRMFATVAPKPVPLVSYGLFALRDAFTIMASFSL